MNPSQFLCRFFAVTVGGLYQLYRDNFKVVYMKKIANRSNNPANVPKHPNSDQCIAITVQSGMIPYRHQKWPAPNLPKIDVFSNEAVTEQGATSRVVGLFLHESDARICLASESTDIEDPNWKDCTKATIAALKNDPGFIVSRIPAIGFPPDFFP